MKTLHGSGISTNIIDNNEVSTNTTVQTKCMHKTNGNRNVSEVIISPPSFLCLSYLSWGTRKYKPLHTYYG